MVSDRGVESVAQHCHNLHLLNIQDCQVGLNTYRMVKKFCKRCMLAGGYEDDEDNGDTFLYTGAGGRDLRELQSRVSTRH